MNSNRNLRLLRWTLAYLGAVAALAPRLGMTQGLLDGYWGLSLNEDQTEYLPGSDEGDYAGLPVTLAAVTAAHAWNPELINLPTMQCEPFGLTYGQRALGVLHVWDNRDPYTQEQASIDTWLSPYGQLRHIWMLPHPHPPSWAVQSWVGYSTGKWVGNVLYVHTDMIKPYYLTRNGLPLDDRATLEERFMVYGDVMTDVMMISDPAYLTRPVIESKNFNRLPHGAAAPYPCRPNDEVPHPTGLVPMHPPGESPFQAWGPVRVGEPLKAAQGGAVTMFPQYQEAMSGFPPNPKFSQITQAEQAAERQRGLTTKGDYATSK